MSDPNLENLVQMGAELAINDSAPVAIGITAIRPVLNACRFDDTNYLVTIPTIVLPRSPLSRSKLNKKLKAKVAIKNSFRRFSHSHTLGLRKPSSLLAYRPVVSICQRRA
jgi:hypothetical protein